MEELCSKLLDLANAKFTNDTEKSNNHQLCEEFDGAFKCKLEDLHETMEACNFDKAALCSEINMFLKDSNYDDFCRRIKRCDDDWATAHAEFQILQSRRQGLINTKIALEQACEETDKQLELALIELDELVNCESQ